MIKKINITNQATIKNLSIEPYQVNYVFGGNGSGKTTISNYLENPVNYTNGSVVKDTDSEVLVYNKHFIDSNFTDKSAIHGIFTLGESAVEAMTFIEEKEKEKKELEKKLANYKSSIDALQKEINSLVSNHEKNCWQVEKQFDKLFTNALAGCRSSIKAFAQKNDKSFSGIFYEEQSENLLSTYAQIFAKEIQEHNLLKELDVDLQSCETSTLFSKNIVKSSESNFSKFIETLGNLNWVSQGMNYLDDSKKCPFCQQTLTDECINELQTLFDDTYVTALKQLKQLQISYNEQETKINKFFEDTLSQLEEIPFISNDRLKELQKELLNIISKNKDLIAKKISSPATPCILQRTDDLIEQISEELTQINKQIQKNNILSKDIKRARNEFIDKLWNFIANNKLYSENEQFKNNLKGKNKGMKHLLDLEKQCQDDITACNSAITEKRLHIVCIDNAVDEINSLLTGFGFNGFKIEKKDELSYRLVRPDGSEVKESLSEGEHRFITFLYFYQLVKGTLNRDSVSRNKILVIDDPISSLDSNILFIVSYLVRDLISKCLLGSNIEQVFVLTHNIYFHQEICFKDRRNNISETKERFWVLRKINEETQINDYKDNQIKSSYELLWQEYKNPNTDSALICNTMRRILEHYFNIIGHYDYAKLIDSFDGQEKIICRTLLPYINTGSHIINDDLHLSIDLDMVDNYKLIFKKIFENTHQLDHYNMMMGIDQN